jgi:hypothetical protein
LDGIGFLVQGQYIHGVWTSWMAYTGGAQPFSVANFVNNSPMNTINPIAPNAGSIDPFREGQPMLGTPRNFTLLFKPAGYTGAMAASLAGVPAASINPANIKDYPTIGHGNTGSFWILAKRNDEKHVPDHHGGQPRNGAAGGLPEVQPDPRSSPEAADQPAQFPKPRDDSDSVRTQEWHEF